MKKIPTLFVRDKDNMSLVTRNVNPKCEWVILGEGIATRKYDGTCCKIENGILYKRREVKANKKEPDGFILKEHDLNTGKKFGWLLVDFSLKENQWYKEGFDNSTINIQPYEDGTYELVGPKIQGNPEKYKNHCLIKHAQTIYKTTPRTFDELRHWFLNFDIEGIVFHHPDGRMCKIKQRDFGLKR